MFYSDAGAAQLDLVAYLYSNQIGLLILLFFFLLAFCYAFICDVIILNAWFVWHQLEQRKDPCLNVDNDS